MQELLKNNDDQYRILDAAEARRAGTAEHEKLLRGVAEYRRRERLDVDGKADLWRRKYHLGCALLVSAYDTVEILDAMIESRMQRVH